MKWNVIMSSGQVTTVEADSVKQNEERSRVTFFDSDENPIASFVGAAAYYPAIEDSEVQ